MFKSTKECSGEYNVIGRFDTGYNNIPCVIRVLKVHNGWIGEITTQYGVKHRTDVAPSKRDILRYEIKKTMKKNDVREY